MAAEDRARTLQQSLPELDGKYPRLVHLAPALVGTSHPRLVLRRLRPDDRQPRGYLHLSPL